MAVQQRLSNNRMSMRAVMLWCMSVAIAASLASAVMLFVMTRPSLEVVSSWSFEIDSKTYYLSVLELGLDWRGFPLYPAKRHGIYVGLEPGHPTYGHWIDFTFHPFPDNLKTHLQRATVEVDTGGTGVILVLPSQHRLFIPAEMFTKGR